MLAAVRTPYFASLTKAYEETVKLFERRNEAPTLKRFEELLRRTWKSQVKGVFVLPFSGTLPCLVGSTRTLV